MSSLQGIVDSPRVKRYVPWLAALVLAAGIVAFLLAYFRNTAPANPNAQISNQPAQTVPSLGKLVPLSPSARRVAAGFIDAAVRGKSATRAWELSGPAIRAGYTSLAQWKRDWNNPSVGVPIAPYPAGERAQLSIDYSRQKEAQLKFFLFPRAGVKEKPQTFLMVLDRVGRGKRSHWVVNNWQTFAPPAIPSQQ